MRLCIARLCCRLHAVGRRNHSVLVAPPCERIIIPRAGNTTLPISVHAPLIGSQAAFPSAVLYFPRGLSQSEQDETTVINALRSTVPHQIVQVHYRFDKDHQHPSAIYDCLSAFEWTCENILSPDAGKSGRKGGIATCGELIGGSLATMLALTECRARNPRVLAAAVNSPILDWTDLEPTKRARRKKAVTREADPADAVAGALQTIRERNFKKPADLYDPFASPLLFFRSAGSLAPSPAASNSDMDLAFEHHDDEDLNPSAHDEDQAIAEDVSRPRSSKQFPSRAYGLILPKVHITSGTTSTLGFQVDEFVQQYSQSVLRQRRAPVRRRARRHDNDYFDHDPLEVPSLEELAQDQAAYVDKILQHQTYDGSGLWDCTPAGQAAVHDMAMWMRKSLDTQ